MIDGNLKGIMYISSDKAYFNSGITNRDFSNSETLLRQARKSKLSEGLFDSKADDNFEQMFDQELANSSSKLVDIGIADAIVRQMSKTRI